MTGAAEDPYSVLGVPRAASQDEITRAYRRLLRQHHPDTRADDGARSQATQADPGEIRSQAAQPDPDEALQRILTAYAMLHDPRRRAEHDRRSHPRPAPADPPPAPARPRRMRGGDPRSPLLWAGPVHWDPAPASPARPAGPDPLGSSATPPAASLRPVSRTGWDDDLVSALLALLHRWHRPYP